MTSKLIWRVAAEATKELLDSVTRERDELRAENADLRAAFDMIAPRCGVCDEPLTVEQVLSLSGPGEIVEWLHAACVT